MTGIGEDAALRQAGLEACGPQGQHGVAMAERVNESGVWVLPDEAATLALGARLGAWLCEGDVVCLQGPLGAGKTTLARGAVRAWLGDDEAEAPSPTFTLAQLYEGSRGTLWHIDLYRLTEPEEAVEIGIEDAMASGACLIEWAERLGPLLPPDRMELALTMDGEGRIARLTTFGAARRFLDQ
jgi:tRNA threonylcarbamoyladenosine biosynthesis protein TsaE